MSKREGKADGCVCPTTCDTCMCAEGQYTLDVVVPEDDDQDADDGGPDDYVGEQYGLMIRADDHRRACAGAGIGEEGLDDQEVGPEVDAAEEAMEAAAKRTKERAAAADTVDPGNNI